MHLIYVHLWMFSIQWIKIILLPTEIINLFHSAVCYQAQSLNFQIQNLRVIFDTYPLLATWTSSPVDVATESNGWDALMSSPSSCLSHCLASFLIHQNFSMVLLMSSLSHCLASFLIHQNFSMVLLMSSWRSHPQIISHLYFSLLLKRPWFLPHSTLSHASHHLLLVALSRSWILIPLPISSFIFFIIIQLVFYLFIFFFF